MITLGEIALSEYNLLGAVNEEELLGALEAAPVADRKKFLKKIQSQQKPITVIPSNNSRGEFEKRIPMLPRETQAGIASKALQAVNVAIYLSKNISLSKIAKMLRDDDNKVVGVSNISSAKLEKGNIMLLHSIILLAGTATGTQTIFDVNFDIIPEIIRNGEFEFRANGTTIIPAMSCEVFNTTDMKARKGCFTLDNPKMIFDQQAMEMNIEWGTNTPANFFLKAILMGTSVTKY
ncbi:MAG: hypothetical protein NTW49_08830 [Bacteroidia bacterium]|nr:hypothetical protein [Bacteroidia bacterium]